jgi:hypothetical protein
MEFVWMKNNKLVSSWGIVGGLVIILLVAQFLQPADMKTQASPVETQAIYLPVVMKNYPKIYQFGVHSENYSSSINQRAVNANNYWVRQWAFAWDLIEATPGVYDWTKVNENALRRAGQNGMQTIAVIQFAPSWAQKYPPYACGPIAESALPAFVNFLTQLVRRYSGPPYNVKYWEVGNEPDVDRRLSGITYRNLFGCWGDQDDAYGYGGGYFAEMLKYAYPAIKAADPGASVLIGGLLLNCDYTHTYDPPKDCSPSKFLDGILNHNGANDGANYFDIVSFHGYPTFNGSLSSDINYPSWKHRGGVVMGKIDFLRTIMSQHGVSKPILHTEGSLTCPEWSPTICSPPIASFYEAQANYVVWLFIRNWATGLLGTAWFTIEGPGWRYAGLLDAQQNPKPAYYAYQYLTQKMHYAEFVREITDYSSFPVKAFEFTSPTQLIWVLWSTDEIDHMVTLPMNAQHLYDKYGVEQTLPVDKTISVNYPVYVDLSK